MNLTPILLGAALGCGALLCWQGIRRLTNKDLPEPERRKGLWYLYAGLAATGGSMLAFGFIGN